jgi:hypothetical protein
MKIARMLRKRLRPIRRRVKPPKRDERFYMHMRKRPREWSMITTARVMVDK